jgi:hypothetical protein
VLIEPLLKAGMQTQVLHVFTRKPSGSVCLLDGKCWELASYIRFHNVELPSAAAVLHINAGNAIPARRADFFFGFSARRLFRRFARADRSPRHAPSASFLNQFRALLQQEAHLAFRRDVP